MDNLKKKYYEGLKKWEENLDVILRKEEEYKSLLVRRYEDSINNVKEELKKYSYENGFQIVEKNNFIESKFGDNYFSIRVHFNDIFPNDRYSFGLTIIEETRREFIIYLAPSVKLYIPKLSKSINRPRPKNEIETKKYIELLQDEYLFIDEKNNELKTITFILCYHNVNYKLSDINELESFSTFTSILKKLINN